MVDCRNVDYRQGDHMNRIFVFLTASIFAWAGCATSTQKVGTPEPKPVEQPPIQQIKSDSKKEKIVIIRIPRLVKESSLQSDGTVDEIRTYSYSPDGSRLEKEELKDSTSQDILETVEYKYKKDAVAERIVLDRDKKSKGKKAFIYTAAGLVDSETFYDKKDLVQAVSRYTYDTAGRKTEWTTLDASGVVLATTKYGYSNERLRQITLLGPSGSLDMEITVAYDEKGNKIRETYTNSTGKTEKEITFGYDAMNRLVSENTLSPARTVLSKVEYAYPGDSVEAGKTVYLDGRGKIKKTVIFEYAYREEKKTVYE